MVQSRYLGSDEAIAQQDAAINQANQSNLAAVDAIGKATGGYINSVVEGQQNLSRLQLERDAAAAKSQAGWKGLGDAVQQGVAAYGQYQANQEKIAYTKAQAEQRTAEAQARAEKEAAEANAKAAAQAAKEADEREYAGAVDELGTLESKTEASNWAEGESNFKTTAAQVLARHPNLSRDNQAKLIDRINGRITERGKKVGGEIYDEAEKLRNAQADTDGKKLLISLTPKIQQIRLANPTDQAAPILQEISTNLDDYIASNNGLTPAQKASNVNAVVEQVRLAYGEKSAAYIKLVNDTGAFNVWNRGIAEAQAKLQQGGSQEEYLQTVEKLKLTTGRDYSSAFFGLGEKQKLASEIAESANRLEQNIENARRKAAQNFEYSSSSVRGLAAGIIVDRDLLLKLQQNPNTKDSPGVKAATALAGRIQKAREEQAALGIDNAKTAEQLASLNVRKASNVAETTRAIASKLSAGQALSPQEQLAKLQLEQLAATNPQVAAALQAASAGDTNQTASAKQQQIKDLQTALDANNAAIAESQKAAQATYNARVEKFKTDYADLYRQFGSIPSDKDLQNFYKASQTSLQNDQQRLQQQLEQSTTNALPGFGATGNFNKVGGNLAVSDSPNGKGYVVAPRSRLHVQTKNPDGGAPFITPLMAGVNANNSMNRGHMGGGYKAGRSGGRQHAGADFPVSVGQQTASVVSGTVVKIGNDPQGYGNYVDIRGDNGFVYRYAHQRPFVKVGQRLNAGDAVSTPNGSGAGDPHLHFEVRTAQSYASSTFGINGTIDPIAHLRELTKQAGTTVGTAGNMRNASQSVVVGSLPWMKTDRNTLFTPQGGALQAGLFQQIGKPVQSVQQTFTNQRPFSKGGSVGYMAGTPSYNTNDDLGYAYLRERPELRVAITKAAQTLEVPAAWIADIAAQETGNFRLAEQVHPGSPNRNYGLFGFGSDSGVNNWTKLNPVQQVEAYTKYMLSEGWQKAKGANGTLAQFWAVTRGGVAWRNRLLKGESPEALRTENGMTFADELRLLGNHVGREYAIPGGMRSERARRNRAVRKQATSNTSQGLAFNNSSEAIARG